MRNFRELEIWKGGVSLVKEVYSLINTLPESERFGLQSQIRRSSISIPTNIAEGCGRDSNQDFKRFLHISLGSTYELETQIIISIELEMIDQNKGMAIINSCRTLQRQISSFMKHLSQ